MKTLGICYDNVLSLAKQKDVSVSTALNQLKLNGYNYVDVDYNLIYGDSSILSNIFKNGFSVSSVIVNSNLTDSLNVISELSVIDFCFHYNIRGVVIVLQDFIKDENTLSILKKNLRRIVKYANNFNVKIMIKNANSISNISTKNDLLDILKNVKGLFLCLDISSYFKAVNTPFDNEESFALYISKVYINDVKRVENEFVYSVLNSGETNVIENIKNFKKLDKNVDFAIYSILENCDIEDILINSALNYLMEINYGQN